MRIRGYFDRKGYHPCPYGKLGTCCLKKNKDQEPEDKNRDGYADMVKVIDSVSRLKPQVKNQAEIRRQLSFWIKEGLRSGMPLGELQRILRKNTVHPRLGKIQQVYTVEGSAEIARVACAACVEKRRHIPDRCRKGLE